ncbi:MAG: ABC transporter ATP-binding protein/permease [Mycobacteriales bacterium]
MPEAVVEAHGVCKSYGGRTVLDGVDLRLERGRCVAVLGPNGAGKTTLLEILEGYRSRDSGEVQVLGTDPAVPTGAWRDRIGLMLQSASLPAGLTVAETVARFASCYHRPRPVPDVLRQVGLADRPGTRASRLSGGQLRRLDLAVALVGDPELVFLDEPTTGFDPVARRQAWTVLKSLTEAGTSVLLTTHYLDEAAKLAEQLVVVAGGRVIAAGRPDELTQSGAALQIRVAAGVLDAAPDALRSRFVSDEHGQQMQTASPEADLHALTGWALFGVTSATFLPLCIGLVQKREAGVLKRLRGTPLPASHFIAGVVGTSAALSLALTVVLVVVGVVGYDVGLIAAGVPGALLALLLGGATMSALGIALTAAGSTPQGANAVANASVLPLYFISGIFIRSTELPDALLSVAAYFPVRAFFKAAQPAFDPTATDILPLRWLTVLLAWLVVAVLVAVRTFRWEPSRST